MSEIFFRELGLPEPDCNLGVSGGSQTEQTAEIMRRLEPALQASRPDLLLVVGDVNSTMAAALVAAKSGIPIAHVEAGLRSFDRAMPEEINRLVTDALSDYLFASEPSGVANLSAEGVPKERIFLTGNVMIDTLLRFREAAAKSDILSRLGLEPRQYALATLHRPANVDEPAALERIIGALSQIGRKLPVLFPIHPRTRQRVEELGLPCDGLRITAPIGYVDFVRLMSEARLVLTDSGGIQEETTILGVPCLTLRENTERPITIDKGTNRLVGLRPADILAAAEDASGGPPREWQKPELWDGKAAPRILDILERQFPE
jgi:UDP-N-acetylglucosamine 2-epimerase (non-hydrolysing)